ncbi:hypothetical protein AV530_003908 [Patagioenas fasciata monilis]|uniref:Uncharacterized protein n=1 Tax=Patagioenas fasciata monilis TaxID=372326 RepID=A0A1V4KZ67_PATFA|nr:hypothetical protein AV530_003908 [Patagioenas fasciata monilis]
MLWSLLLFRTLLTAESVFPKLRDNPEQEIITQKILWAELAPGCPPLLPPLPGGERAPSRRRQGSSV